MSYECLLQFIGWRHYNLQEWIELSVWLRVMNRFFSPIHHHSNRWNWKFLCELALVIEVGNQMRKLSLVISIRECSCLKQLFLLLFLSTFSSSSSFSSIWSSSFRVMALSSASPFVYALNLPIDLRFRVSSDVFFLIKLNLSLLSILVLDSNCLRRTVNKNLKKYC